MYNCLQKVPAQKAGGLFLRRLQSKEKVKFFSVWASKVKWSLFAVFSGMLFDTQTLTQLAFFLLQTENLLSKLSTLGLSRSVFPPVLHTFTLSSSSPPWLAPAGTNFGTQFYSLSSLHIKNIFKILAHVTINDFLILKIQIFSAVWYNAILGR